MDKMVWVDLETTGLSATHDYVLEAGLIVTDKNLSILGSWSSLVKNHENLPVSPSTRTLRPKPDWRDRIAADDHVTRMHDDSGLMDELNALPDEYRRADGQVLSYEPAVVAYQGFKWLTETMGLEPGKYPMVGSSVHFDRRFLDEHMITLLSFFTYRNIDVSSIKELCKVFNPTLRSIMERDPQFNKANAKHRVLDDLRASIAELRFYKEWFLTTTEENDIEELAKHYDPTGPVVTHPYS